MVGDLAELVDPTLADWIAGSVSYVTTMVDRITPTTSPEDLETVKRATGLEDRCPVATKLFSEWVLSGAFPGGRPAWEDAGATVADDIEPYEQCKLWLLNGGHSLLGLRRISPGAPDGGRCGGRRDLPRLAGGVVVGGVWASPLP